MKRILLALLLLGGLAANTRALQFDLLASRVAEGTSLSEMGATLAFAIDGAPDAVRPATLVAGPDGSPARYHFQFDYDSLYLPLQEAGQSVTYSLLTVSVCGHAATRAYNNAEYTHVLSFPINLPSTFGPGDLPFPDCDNPVAPAAAPRGFSLAEAAPNPFNPATRLRVTLATAGPLRLRVFDLEGRLVETLFDGALPAGERDFIWRPAVTASGLYLVLAEGGGGRMARRVLLLK